MSDVYRKYIEETLGAGLIQNMVDMMSAQFSAMGVEVSTEFETRMQAHLNIADISEPLLGFLEEVYTPEEIKLLDDFANSAIGRKAQASTSNPAFKRVMSDLAKDLEPKMQAFMEGEGKELLGFPNA